MIQLSEVIECMGNSPQRLRMLDILTENKMDLRDLKDALNSPRTTAQRNLSVLEEQGWIKESDNGYKATSIGCLIYKEFDKMNQTIETVDSLAPFFRQVESPGEIDIGQLGDSTLTVPEPDRPNAPTARLFEQFGSEDHVSIVSPIVSPVLVEFSTSTDRGPAVLEYVVPDDRVASLSEQLQSNSTNLAGIDGPDRLTIGICEEKPPFGMFVSEETLALVAYDDVGRIEALVESSSPNSIEWGKHRYRTYDEKSDPFVDEISS